MWKCTDSSFGRFLQLCACIIYANLKKCIFDANKTPLLACIVGKHGVRPDPEKIKAITDLPVPTDVKGLRNFLGLAA